MKLIHIYKQTFAIPAVIISGFLLNGLILGSIKPQLNKESHAHGKLIAKHDWTNAALGADGSASLTKIVLDDGQIRQAGIKTQTAGPQDLKIILDLPGEIRLNEDLTSHITPPLPGLVKILSANLGELVKKDQLLVGIASTVIAEKSSMLVSAQKRLESARAAYAREKASKIIPEPDILYSQQAVRDAENAVHNAQQKLKVLGANPNLADDSKDYLNVYEIHAPFDGVIVDKHIGLGVAVKADDNILTISDLSSVWAEFSVPAKDLSNLRIGDQARIEAVDSGAKINGKLAYLGQLIGEKSQTAIARVQIENPQMAWRPGLKVDVEILADKTNTPVAVNNEAVTSINGVAIVFVRTTDGFIAQPVVTGRSDSNFIEINAGLNPGSAYAIDAEAVNNYEAIE
jgi:cobalt-zinc-cadmium efflux system membrane fusion protein